MFSQSSNQSLWTLTLIAIIFPVHFGKIGMSLTIRPIVQADSEACGKIGYEAHKVISSAHGYPSEQPSIEFAVGMIKTCLSTQIHGVLWPNATEEFLAASSFMYFHLLQLLQ